VSDHLRKVQTGDPLRIPALAYNAFVDSAIDYKNRMSGPTRSPNGGLSDAAVLLVRNDTGADLPPGSIVELGDILVDIPDAGDASKVLQNVIVEGLTPTAGGFGPVAVTREPISDGKVGRAMLEGVIACRLELRSALHRFADVLPGSTLLASRGVGRFEILSLPPSVTVSEDDADPRWAIVRRVADGLVRILARITGSTSIASNQWEYDWEEINITDAGAIEVVSGGRTSAASGKARNGIEFPNTGSGVEGNGVDRGYLPMSFTMRPIVSGNVVVLEGPFGRAAMPTAATWLFAIPNADDGPCPEPEA
jgi:hypothetical protein